MLPRAYNFLTTFPQCHNWPTAFSKLLHNRFTSFQQPLHNCSLTFPRLFHKFSTIFHKFSTHFRKFFEKFSATSSRPPSLNTLAILSCSRTFNLILPLKKLSLSCIATIITAYVLLLAFRAATPFWVDNIELSHWYKVDKVFYTPEAKLRCVKLHHT